MMDINFIEILLYIVNIIILFLVLRKLLYKPIVKFLNARTDDIQKQLDEAAQKQTQAEQLKAKYDEMVANAQDLAAQLISKSKQLADTQATQIMDQAVEDVATMKLLATKQITQQKQLAVAEMRQDVTDMAIQIAEKVLRREISLADNKKIIDEFFEKVG